jgi:hypothetical protein
MLKVAPAGSAMGEPGSASRPGSWNVRDRDSSPAFWDDGALWRPIVPASPHRRGRSLVDWEGCDHTDGTPAASHHSGRTHLIAPPGGARYDIVRCATPRRVVVPAQCQTPHPEGGPFGARFDALGSWPAESQTPQSTAIPTRTWTLSRMLSSIRPFGTMGHECGPGTPSGKDSSHPDGLGWRFPWDSMAHAHASPHPCAPNSAVQALLGRCRV